MSYYYGKHSHDDGSWLTVIICLVLIFAIVFGVNACSATTWNNGICPDCEVRYELRGVSRGLKYYTCPECGQEVSKY